MDSKICKKCNEDKPLAEFRNQRSNKAGGFKKHYCIECDDAYNKARYEQNRDYHIQKVREWQAENPDKVKGYKKKFSAKGA